MDEMTRARLLVGVDLLLTDPESLGNDALEGDLCILREQLRPQATMLITARSAAGAGAGPALRAERCRSAPGRTR
jgi:hypothetical protein